MKKRKRKRKHKGFNLWGALKFSLVIFGFYSFVLKLVTGLPIMFKLAMYGLWCKIVR